MQVTYNEAAYLDNDQSKECYLNATDAAYDYGKEIDSTSTCSLTVRVKILDRNNYNTTCTSFYVKSSVGSRAILQGSSGPPTSHSHAHNFSMIFIIKIHSKF